MTWLLIREDTPPEGTTFTNAIEVEICPDDGTVYATKAIMCPVCSLRPDPRWGG